MKDVKEITLLGIMTAIIIVMTAIPGLGYIPIGGMNATIVHIPVIIISIVKGPKLGSVLGVIFGVTSLLNAILRPVITSFMFMNPIISIVPRLLIGLGTGYIYILLKKTKLNKNFSVILSSAIGSMINTVGVLGLIFLLYGQKYLEITGRTGQSAIKALLYIASTQGFVEMIVCVIISYPIIKALIKYESRN